ncbi:uncharacterized protein N7477_006774 [Penicillium maclennaniae]|uniref:uncharacterized protein n=1 Tax=Penicillium maclennaniae TaxID=1343394 RepID=UPI0025424F37|nr:uncharacterized protein N7477_006774 [Penicillium maclennaniae]KAJ5668204.1 hypothetical protein N7477_006774 [Penicillium maclennaniae]
MYLKQVSDEVMGNTPLEGNALAYRICVEPEEVDGPRNNLEPGLHTSFCLMVDEECMRSVIGWKGDGAKAVNNTLDEEDILFCCDCVAFTKFYCAQFECDETAELVPDGDTV